MRFNDRNTRAERITRGGCKEEAIKEFFDNFIQNCQVNYSPGEDITVDERLAVYRGRCAFKVYMKSKPGRYGIKIWAAADKSGYVSNCQIYNGNINNRREVNQGQRVVLQMVEPFFNTGRGTTTDNFFTSLPLAKELMERKLSLTGTMRASVP